MNFDPDSEAVTMEFEVGEEVLIDPYDGDEEIIQEEIDDEEAECDNNEDDECDQEDNSQEQDQEQSDLSDGDMQDDAPSIENGHQGSSSNVCEEKNSHSNANQMPLPIDHEGLTSSRLSRMSNNNVHPQPSQLVNEVEPTPVKSSQSISPFNYIISQPQTRLVILNDSKKTDTFTSCLCSAKPNISQGQSVSKTLFCQAIDEFDGKLIGCVNQAKLSFLFRSSKRVPFRVFCEVHSTRLRRHHCCPGCGIFLTQGYFLQCHSLPKQVHLFHKTCQLTNSANISSGNQLCAHCGKESPMNSVRIHMNGDILTDSNLYYLWQTPLLKTSTARISSIKPSTGKFTSSQISVDEENPPLLPIQGSDRNLSLSRLPAGLERQQLEAILSALQNAEKKASVLKASSNKNMVNIVKSGDVEKVVVMLANGFDANTRFVDQENETLLHIAARSGNLLIVHLLRQAEANLDVTNSKLVTPLMAAVEAAKADENHTFLPVVTYLIKAGASVDHKDNEGLNVLHYAAKEGNYEAVKALLSHPKVAINSQDRDGNSALSYATEEAQLPLVQLLLEAGADPNIQDDEGNVCLHWAASSGDVSVVEKLIDLTPDINIPNVNYDTPLHIAAKKNNHQVVQYLLTRNADYTAVNKSNETALMCCPPNSDSSFALSLKVGLNKGASKRKFPSEKYIHRDISKGKEKYPISVVNGVDNEQPPSNYTYVVSNCETTRTNVDLTISSLSACKCENGCNSDRCLCANLSFECWYDRQGKLVDGFKFHDPPMIFECNRACACWSNCGNRIVQKGISARLQVFKSPGQKGWGVRTLNLIPKGAFVCEYVGEVISDSEANLRQDDSYLFDLDKRDGETLYCLDARFYGNVSRFINHGCDPNLTPVKVFIDHQDLAFPRMALFANRAINPYEEIRFDYGEKFWVIKYKWFTCECNSYVCRYSKEKIHKTLAPRYKKIAEEQALRQIQQRNQGQAGDQINSINGHSQYMSNGVAQ